MQAALRVKQQRKIPFSGFHSSKPLLYFLMGELGSVGLGTGDQSLGCRKYLFGDLLELGDRVLKPFHGGFAARPIILFEAGQYVGVGREGFGHG